MQKSSQRVSDETLHSQRERSVIWRGRIFEIRHGGGQCYELNCASNFPTNDRKYGVNEPKRGASSHFRVANHPHWGAWRRCAA
jgi:hypothetical protein